MLASLLFALLLLISPILAQDPCGSVECAIVDDVSIAVDAAEVAGKGPAQPFFAPYDDVEEEVLRVLDGAKEEVVIAHYNIRRESILEKLVELSRRGVKVRVAVDKTNAGREWNIGDDMLEQAGIEVVRTKPKGSTALMHFKICVIDQETVMTGSYNWNATAALANDENMLVVRDKQLAATYRSEVLEVLGDGESSFNGGKVNEFFELHFAPDERLDSVLKSQLDRAKESIEIAMFGLTERKVQDALIKALERGVKVSIVTEQKNANKTPLDEKVEQAGALVVRAANRVGPYSAMHHKYAVIDGKRLITGACNWTKNGTRYSDEDILVVDSEALALQYQDNFRDLQHVYGGIDSPSDREAAPVMFHAEHDGTGWGDRVFVVGNDPALGGWDPHRGVELKTSDDLFPAWAGHLRLPAGEEVEYKFVTVKADGSVEWEPGPNRRLQVPESGRAVVMAGEYGDTSSSWTPAGHIDAAVAIPSYLTRNSDGAYSSPGGLTYPTELGYGNRAAHVLDHFEESSEKSSQGVFTITRDEVFPMIDQAYGRIAEDPGRYHAEDQGSRQVYDVPMGEVIGYVGGQEGSHAEASTLRVVLQNGNEVVTSFPVAP
jgi:phosphatidylserine/phosphatidylglycerophosphate/cardiolipin synthase-like enzyme